MVSQRLNFVSAFNCINPANLTVQANKPARRQAESPQARLPSLDSRIKWFLAASVMLALLTLAMFGDVLFFNHTRVLSHPFADLFQQFIPWRAFGFGELRAGNLPLWNPYIFSGAPFLGGFQSALLYPPNWLFLVLPLVPAINYSIALHVFLAGLFMYCWTSNRGLHPTSSFLSAVLFMFCGAHFLHVYQGHLCNLCAITWMPLVFLSIDGWLSSRKTGWCLLGMVVTALQILAGQPQYVFYTAVAAVIYSALCLVSCSRPVSALAGLMAIVAGAFALSAVQLLTGLDAARETLRSAGLSYEIASMFSFPPENFLTLFAPGFFGDMVATPYWGRCYLWEVSVFIGMTGFVLAAFGAIKGPPAQRRFSITMVIVLFVIALGRHTPLFHLLYSWAPGFDKFRGIAKFLAPASIFLILLAGIGFDQLRCQRPRALLLTLLTGAAAIGFACGALLLQAAASQADSSFWPAILRATLASGETLSLAPGTYSTPSFILQTALCSSRSLFVAAIVLGLLAVAFAFGHKARWPAHLVLILAVAEMFLFARSSIVTFDIAEAYLPGLKACLDKHPGDWRLMNVANPNSAMTIRAPDVWGYDSVVERRYAEFMTFLQGGDPSQPTQYIQPENPRLDPLLTMLRCRFVSVPGADANQILESDASMPRLNLLQSCQVITGRDAIFRAMRNPDFDPRRNVILEKEPVPKPIFSSASGSVRLIESSTDSLLVEAELPAPSILLITDTYSPGWRAVPCGNSVQSNYQLLPANYVLRAVPLMAGHHRLKIEYRPLAFVIGKWTSLVSTSAFLAFLFLQCSLRAMAKKRQRLAAQEGRQKAIPNW